MKNLLTENLDKFDSKGDPSYFFDKDHRLRGEISIQLIKDVAKKKPNHPQKLLSIACSTGVIEEKIKNQLGIEVYGIDAAKNPLHLAKKRGIITKYVDVNKSLPFRNGYFDFVFAGEIIEHIFDTKSFMKEICRVLKLGGYLVLTTPNFARFDDRLKLLFGKTPRQIIPLHPYLYLHIRHFTFDSLKKLFFLCGFSEIVLKTNVLSMDIFGKELILYSKILTRFFPTFGSTLITRAKNSKKT